jgi:hypothetical protein
VVLVMLVMMLALVAAAVLLVLLVLLVPVRNRVGYRLASCLLQYCVCASFLCRPSRTCRRLSRTPMTRPPWMI